MNAPLRQRLAGERWHFQHGPIDCVIGADGEPAAVERALEAAWARFGGVLDELVADLPALRANLAQAAGHTVQVRGPIAQRMVAACRPYAERGLFVTAMAAVAGSVAQELIAFFERPGIRRAYVNNGGDIALHLAPGEAFDIGLVVDPNRLPQGADGQFRIDAASGVRGIATSGWRGRSLSLGIVDSVTVLAASAAQADAAATLIANAVVASDPRIVRAPANTLRDDSDLGELLATVQVPTLPRSTVEQALAAGAAFARHEIAAGRVRAACLCLQGEVRMLDAPGAPGADNAHAARAAPPGRGVGAWPHGSARANCSGPEPGAAAGFHRSPSALPGPILETAPPTLSCAAKLAGA